MNMLVLKILKILKWNLNLNYGGLLLFLISYFILNAKNIDI